MGLKSTRSALAMVAMMLLARAGQAEPLVGECPADDSPLAPIFAPIDAARAAPALPSCASEQMRSIFDSVAPVATRGNTLPGLLATSRNSASPQALLRGVNIFGQMSASIAAATREVDLQTWAWDPDSDGSSQILSGLAALDRRLSADGGAPVTVRFLVEQMPVAMRYPDALAKKIAALQLDPSRVKVELASYRHSGMGADHAKTLVVDGKTAVVTGANLTRNEGGEVPYYDLGFRFDGDVAGALREDFASAWARSQSWTCGTSSRPDSAPVTSPGEPQPTVNDCYEKTVPLPPLGEVANDVPAATCTTMLVLGHASKDSPFASVGDDPLTRAKLGAIRAATNRVRILTPNLNEPAVEAAILAAAKRGVRVEVMLSKRYEETTESVPTRGGPNDETVARLGKALRDAGVCDNVDLRWYSTDGINPVEVNGPPSSHAKYLSVDGAIVIVGSANMDRQSWRNSRETDVAVDSPATTAAWDAQVFTPVYDRAVASKLCTRE